MVEHLCIGALNTVVKVKNAEFYKVRKTVMFTVKTAFIIIKCIIKKRGCTNETFACYHFRYHLLKF